MAWRDGRIRDDVATEQSKLKEADIVIFQFPMYWFSMPAILKGWIDRIMLEGFAFTESEIYKNGHMKVGLQVQATYLFLNEFYDEKNNNKTILVLSGKESFAVGNDWRPKRTL